RYEPQPVAATQAGIASPGGLAFDRDGSLFVAAFGNDVVRRIAPDGTMTTVAGTGDDGDSGDGGLATAARLSGPRALAFGPDGSLYIAEAGGQRIRKVTPDG